MTVLEILLGFGAMVAGGFIGIRRLAFITVVFISGFIAIAAYHAYNPLLASAIAELGVRQINAFFISIFVLVLIPLFAGLYLGIKIINRLGLNELGSGSYYDSSSYATDKIFGSGFGLIVFLILISIISW